MTEKSNRFKNKLGIYNIEYTKFLEKIYFKIESKNNILNKNTQII